MDLLPPPQPIILNGEGPPVEHASPNGTTPSRAPESLLDALQLNLAKTSLYWLEAQRVEKALSRGESADLIKLAQAFAAMKETFPVLADAIAERMK